VVAQRARPRDERSHAVGATAAAAASDARTAPRRAARNLPINGARYDDVRRRCGGFTST